MCDLRTTKFLGEGQTSRVYAAQTSNKKSIAAKVTVRNVQLNPQPCEIEATILERLSQIVPKGVPKFYGASWCRNFKSGVFKPQVHTPDVTQQFVLRMEYFPRGNLKDFITRLHQQKKLTDSILREAISQVVTCLRELHKAVPSFRHNDLHLSNILVGDWKPGNKNYYNTYELTSSGFRCVIYDFNLSTMSGVTNPLLRIPKFKNEFGIYEGNSDKYDLHFFLNSVLDWLNKTKGASKYSETRDFLNRSLPVGYQGNRDAKVNLFRLKPGVSTNSMANFEKIFQDPYFKSLQSELEEGEIRNEPRELPKANLRPTPKSQLLVVESAKNNVTGRVRSSVSERMSYLKLSKSQKFPVEFYSTNRFKVMLNLVTSPEVQGETNNQKRAREQRGFNRAEKEFLAPRPSVRAPTVPVVLAKPFTVPKKPEIKRLNPSQAPPPIEVKAPPFKALKPMPKSTLYKTLNNLLRNETRPKFSVPMSTRNFKSGGILPTIKIEKSYLKCENLDREFLNLIAQEHGLDPSPYRSKAQLCAALKTLHNS